MPNHFQNNNKNNSNSSVFQNALGSISQLAQKFRYGKQLSTDDISLLNNFWKNLENWSQTGEVPPEGDRDIKAMLAAQDKRLKQHKLELDLDFENQPDSQISSFEFSPNINRYLISGKKRLGLRYKGKKRYQENYESAMSALIISADEEDGNLSDKPYTCPNCGSVTTIGMLEQAACPYCDSHFKMGDLYPKVTLFYSSKIQDFSYPFLMGIFALLGAIAGPYIYNFINPSIVQTNIIENVARIALSAVLGALGGVLISLLFIALGAIILLIFYSPFISKYFRQKREAKAFLSNYDSAFSLEYFESKIFSLVNEVLFHENPKEHIQFQASELNPKYKNIVHMDLYKQVTVLDAKEQGDYLVVDAECLVIALIARGKSKRIKKQHLKINMQIIHRKNQKINPEFSIRLVQCPNCGGSYNAYETNVCSYCNSNFDPAFEDWVITNFEIKKSNIWGGLS